MSNALRIGNRSISYEQAKEMVTIQNPLRR